MAKMLTTLGQLLSEARSRLASAGVDDPGLEARLIVEHYSDTKRVDAIASPGRPIGNEVLSAVAEALERRLAGEPVHRILGFREFHGLKLFLSRETLEPRPDTETLVDAVL